MRPLVYGSLPDLRAGDEGQPVDPALGFYFSGLVDGEGCFTISAAGCAFVIKLRLDDRPLLEMLSEQFGGIGKFYVVRNGVPATQRPQVMWTVSRKKEVVWLTELFDTFHLRSKKARDYAVWREAAIAWGACDMSPKLLDPYRDDLKRAREYVEPDEAAA